MNGTSSDITPDQGMIIYEISKVIFCSNIMKVSNIIHTEDLKFAENYLDEIITKVSISNLDFPLVNIQLLLKLEKIKISPTNRLLLFESDDINFLFLVEKVHHIISLNSDQNSLVIDTEDTEGLDYIVGKLNIDGHKTLVLDLEKIGRDYTNELSKI